MLTTSKLKWVTLQSMNGSRGLRHKDTAIPLSISPSYWYLLADGVARLVTVVIVREQRCRREEDIIEFIDLSASNIC